VRLYCFAITILWMYKKLSQPKSWNQIEHTMGNAQKVMRTFQKRRTQHYTDIF